MGKLFVILYNVSSVHKVIEFVKTAYAFDDNVIPVIVKPIGAAAQIGVPEVNKLSYKLNKPLIVLPELKDIIDVLGIKDNYMVTSRGNEMLIDEIFNTNGDVAITINGGDTDFTKQELEYGKATTFKEIPLGLPSTALLAIILYRLKIIKEQR
ncbi:recombinase RecB [Desulfurococcaceae archaeon MEX13E-LK6-19]|nr:recombinase RecB [Desulfurococcaceae archaeon MEX13E-LK6-19]